MTKISSHGRMPDQHAARCRSAGRQAQPAPCSSASVGWTSTSLLTFRLNDDGRGDWIRTSDLHTPSVMRYQAALRPDLAAASRQGYPTRQGRKGSRVARRRRKGKAGKWVGRLLTLLLAVPALYLVAALIGSLMPVNRGWTEPAAGHDHLHRRQRHPRRHHHAGARPGARLDAADPEARLRRGRPERRAGSPSDRASSGSISTRRRGGTSRRAPSGPRWPAASA